jgi:hypothetical protein
MCQAPDAVEAVDAVESREQRERSEDVATTTASQPARDAVLAANVRSGARSSGLLSVVFLIGDSILVEWATCRREPCDDGRVEGAETSLAWHGQVAIGTNQLRTPPRSRRAGIERVPCGDSRPFHDLRSPAAFRRESVTSSRVSTFRAYVIGVA